MPTVWRRTPEELHKVYVSNSEAFYRAAAGRAYAKELDEFMVHCTTGLWARGGGVTQQHADAVNELHSKGQSKPSLLLWELTSRVCDFSEFLPPLFFWQLAESDAKKGGDASRVLVRMLTNILLYLAAVDDDVSLSEAEYITDCAEKLSAICDSAGVKKSQPPLRAIDYVTSGELSFTEKTYVPATSGKGDSASAQAVAVPDVQEKPSLDELMAELDALIGLEKVKADVKSLINLMKVRKLRAENGLPLPPMSLHLVFSGNPGTGKTTVARLLAGLYAAIGVLETGQLVEVDRSGLVAGYVGQTAIKTGEAVNSAIGGVLFIDEAYSLANGGENDFGRESIETILKAMEDKRDKLIVIVAGYEEPMMKFLESNPGLDSRFNKYIHFPDYDGAELLQIFEGLCKKHSYTLSEDAMEYAKEFFTSLYESRDDNFGNGRDVRNCFEDMVARHSDRVAALESPTKDDLITVLKQDLTIPNEEKLSD